MSEKEIKNKINDGIEMLISSDFDTITKKIKSRKGVLLNMNEEKTKMSKGMVLAFVSVLIVVLGIFTFSYTKENISIASINYDVNPSIELMINSKYKVVKIETMNEDAQKIVGDMDLKGSSIEVATNALLGSMLQLGYISNEKNSILVSVYSKSEKEQTKLEEMLKNDVSEYLSNNNVNGSIVTQVVNDPTRNLKELSEKYNLTLGKAQLVNKIIIVNPLYDFESLSKLTMNELNLLINSEKNHVEDIKVTGKVSESGYIGKEKAQSISLTHAKLNTSKVTNLKANLDFEDGIMVYDVEFEYDNYEYDYEINAITGKIIDFEKENEREDVVIEKSKPNTVSTNEYLSKENVKQLVLKKANITNYTDYDIDFEFIAGVGVYEMDFETNEKEYEYLVNATTGEIINSYTKNDDVDDEDDNTETEEKQSSTNKNYISKSKAKEIALAHAKVQVVSDYEIELDTYKEIKVYEIEFETSLNEYEYKINALNGKILFSDIESKEIDDD